MLAPTFDLGLGSEALKTPAAYLKPIHPKAGNFSIAKICLSHRQVPCGWYPVVKQSVMEACLRPRDGN